MILKGFLLKPDPFHLIPSFCLSCTKPITLLLESAAAKDMSCLIAGYCRVFVDPNLNVFPWVENSKKHRISAEEGMKTINTFSSVLHTSKGWCLLSKSFVFAGYVSRCGSDSDSSSDLDMQPLVTVVSHNEKPCPGVGSSSDPDARKKRIRDRRRSKEKGGKRCKDKIQNEEKDAGPEKERSLLDKEVEEEATERKQDCGQIQIEITDNDSGEQGENVAQERKIGGGGEGRAAEEQPSVSEASDSCHSDSRFLTSPSSDSLDALEEDDLLSCSSSSIHASSLSQTHPHTHGPFQLHPFSQRHVQPHLLGPPPAHSHPLIHFTQDRGSSCRRSGDGADPQLQTTVPTSPSPHQVQQCTEKPCSDVSSLCFAELSRLVDFLPSPPEASEDEEDEEEELRRRKMQKQMDDSARRAGEGGSGSGDGGFKHPLSPSPSSHMEFVFNFDQSDARCYYKLCSNITPDSARSLPRPLHHNKEDDGRQVEALDDDVDDVDTVPILQPPPGFGDSSSDDEFFDASDRFTSPEDPSLGAFPRGGLLFFV